MKNKILIVEDEPELLHMLGLRAQFYNYTCVLEQVGDQCVEKAKLHHPDVILLDLNLPRISGLGLIRELKKDPKLAKIPIVVFIINLPVFIPACLKSPCKTLFGIVIK